MPFAKSYEPRVHSSKGFVPLLITGHLLATPGCQHWSEHYRTIVTESIKAMVLGISNPINSWPPPTDLLFSVLSYNLSYCHIILALTICILVVSLVCQSHSKWPQATHLPFNSPMSHMSEYPITPTLTYYFCHSNSWALAIILFL